MSEKLTTTELLGLFARTPDESRWIDAADSDEYRTLVGYLVQRNTTELA